MKNILLTLLLLSPLAFAEITLKDYAELRFDFDFTKMGKTEFVYIITKCHAVGGFAEQIGMSEGKATRLEYGAWMLKTYKELYPELDEDAHFDLMHEETKPHYLNYLNVYNKNKTNPELLISDFAFCRMFAEL